MSETCFSNLPNFREVGGGKLVNKDGDKVKAGVLYRSSRTDFLTQEEVNTFLGFGFKSIIDMRNRSEFERADGAKLLGNFYEPFVLKRGDATPLKPSFRWGRRLKKDMKTAEKQKGDAGDSQFIGKRYMTNLLTRPFFLHMFYKVNVICRYLSLILLGIDWLIGSHFFAKYFAWHIINSQSLADQYVDMLEYGKYVIKDILQLMLSENNLPTVIHCAHGKDRTGVVVAVVLACIDVDEEDIFADYAESEVYYMWYLTVCMQKIYLTIFALIIVSNEA